MSAPLSPAEQVTVYRFDSAEPAPESLRQRVAEAMYNETEAAERWEWPDVTGVMQRYIYLLADAAIAAMRGER